MRENKTWILGYNRYQGKVVTYSTQKHAEMSGSYWKIVEATSHAEAKEQFLEDVRENHHEIE